MKDKLKPIMKTLFTAEATSRQGSTHHGRSAQNLPVFQSCARRHDGEAGAGLTGGSRARGAESLDAHSRHEKKQ
jgi:hypothetical protein